MKSLSLLSPDSTFVTYTHHLPTPIGHFALLPAEILYYLFDSMPCKPCFWFIGSTITWQRARGVARYQLFGVAFVLVHILRLLAVSSKALSVVLLGYVSSPNGRKRCRIVISKVVSLPRIVEICQGCYDRACFSSEFWAWGITAVSSTSCNCANNINNTILDNIQAYF